MFPLFAEVSSKETMQATKRLACFIRAVFLLNQLQAQSLVLIPRASVISKSSLTCCYSIKQFALSRLETEGCEKHFICSRFGKSLVSFLNMSYLKEIINSRLCDNQVNCSNNHVDRSCSQVHERLLAINH